MKRAIALLLVLLAASGETARTKSTISIRGKEQQLNLYGSIGKDPVILSSGDFGWAGLVVHVAEFLASNGYYVIGLDTRSYLASFTLKDSALNPTDVPGDYATLIELAGKSASAKPILIGVSEGAGLSVLAATDQAVKARIQGILAIGLPDQNELGWKWRDFTIWITKSAPNEPSFMVEDIIGQVSPLPLAEIHSTHDEFLPLEKAKDMFARAGEPKRMWVIDSTNHRFSENRPLLDRRMLEAIQWIRDTR
jgi:pimeloyl-ACP methyl ester carboxylesterase